ncbi:hypothetical protein [Phascolarctobacterium sp.]|uniref:hypothetical protein n=1 Tax=Phascolarctobacterium sp. TaxID=2049039 RepID=UPI0025D3394D|nr:hypothetical protein [uncultured Phascolarctobacterium sp.]
MKNKIITFLAALGIPVSSLGGTSGCTGVCGNCQLSCVPGVVAVVILTCKVISKKLAEKRHMGYE